MDYIEYYRRIWVESLLILPYLISDMRALQIFVCTNLITEKYALTTSKLKEKNLWIFALLRVCFPNRQFSVLRVLSSQTQQAFQKTFWRFLDLKEKIFSFLAIFNQKNGQEKM